MSVLRRGFLSASSMRELTPGALPLDPPVDALRISADDNISITTANGEELDNVAVFAGDYLLVKVTHLRAANVLVYGLLE